MVTLREQLKDPVYKQWFLTNPRIRTHTNTPPFWLYVQREQDGSWSRAGIDTYRQGLKFVAKNIKVIFDMTISAKRQEYQPPVVHLSGKMRHHLPVVLAADDPDLHWCTFCRRLTKFTYFQRHHAMPRYSDASQRRCSICGVRLSFIRRYS